MTSSRSPMSPLLGVAALVALLVLSVLGQRFAGYRLPAAAWLAISTGFVAASAWAIVIYWRRIDEAAQEAQKSAWLWGGSAGMVLGVVADMALSLPQVYPHVRGVVLHLGGALIVGGMLVALGEALGFLVAWAIWWGAKR